MAHYLRLSSLIPSAEAAAKGGDPWRRVIDYLVDVWLDDYRSPGADIVETRASNFSYLFDVAAERLLAAWGVSQGRHGEKRDSARMRGSPQSAGPHYHRGHAIPHSLGGPTDINLVPQLGSVNVGPFRRLEIQAVETPGSLYFTYWKYLGSGGQMPGGVDQGLLIPGQAPRITPHGN
jgi:hypothetical protein